MCVCLALSTSLSLSVGALPSSIYFLRSRPHQVSQETKETRCFAAAWALLSFSQSMGHTPLGRETARYSLAPIRKLEGS